MNKLVSVIVPVYNRAHLVSETIESILSQTYEPIETILINDGSTDESLSVLREYESRFPDKIRVIDQQNQGQIAARNNGIEIAQGEYIAFLDSDDLWLKDKLERQIPLFEDGVGLVYSGTEIIDENGCTIRVERADELISGYIYPQLLVKNRMTGGTVVVTSDALKRVGLFSSDFKAAENWDLWLRICRIYSVRVVPDPLIKYRVHSQNMSGDGQLMLRAKRQIIEKHCDLDSKDRVIASYSRQAYADYHYRAGLNFFAADQYRLARKEFISVLRFSFVYEDTWLRLIRSLIGARGNNLLRSLK
ncbi:glycosyltransferase family 2 protein [Marinobacter sp. F3R11]|uniref:glycosyltransferase family 2 protein n=1 Tax=Marinobacter sp. F3R11 TaxID=2267231 RepID=UPI000DEA69EB|nr:glycosyltransferase [Marinobacter sp. F3R11]RBW49726.1 glycosyl transferase family A [Marinobacter sp. F3R11]